MTSRRLSLGAAAGPLLFTTAWLVLGFISPGYTAWGVHIAPYSAVSQPVSGLGLGPTAPYMNTAFIACGLLMMVGSLGVASSIWPYEPRPRYIVAALLALPGAGAVIDGIFTFESFMPHTGGFVLAISSVVGFPVMGFFLRRKPEWRRLGTALLAAGPLTAALAAVYFATFTPTVAGIQTGVAGLTERVLLIELQAWYVALGWLAFRHSPAPRERKEAVA